MPQRLDVLTDTHRDRFSTLTGSVLDAEKDPQLQELVAEVAKALQTPIALVSLLLDQTQFFRAQYGLPVDLALAQATDRDVSFCQFVVRDGVGFEVNDALIDGRVPKDLVDRYEIRAYLGEPVHIDSIVVGSLCAIDVKPRMFTDDERAVVAKLSIRASKRLKELSQMAQTTRPALLGAAVQPCFAELRNILTPVAFDLHTARVAIADLAPLSRISALSGEGAPALGVLIRAADALAQLRQIVSDLERSHARLFDNIESIESLMVPRGCRTAVAEVMNLSSKLALHHLRAAGGMKWDPVSPDLAIAAPKMVAASAISVALLSMAAAGSRVRGSATESGGQVIIELTSAALDQPTAARIAAEVNDLLDQNVLIRASAASGRIHLRMVAANQDL